MIGRLAPSLLAAALLLAGCGEEDTPRVTAPRWFEEAAEAAGIDFRTTFLAEEQGENFKINLYDHGSGVAVGDYDSDGWDDLYFCNQLGPNALYRNLGDGRFAQVTPTGADLALAERISVMAAWGDYDDDGHLDLFVTTVRGGNALFRNLGADRFQEVTKEAGVAGVAHSQSATWFDGDGDGDLDLLVSNTAKWTSESFNASTKHYRGAEDLFALVASPKEENFYYRNRGDGTFADATKESGLAGTGWSGDTAVFDFDEDGDLDLAVVNMFGATHLYENAGKGRFTDAARRVLGKVSWGAVGGKVFDHDMDGRLDLFLVDMHSDMWMLYDWRPRPGEESIKFPGPFGPMSGAETPEQRTFLARLEVPWDDVVFGSTLFRALGNGRFEEVSDRARVETLWPWGIAAGDFDGDGDEDLFVPAGMGFPYEYHPSALLVNRGDGTFEDRAGVAGLEPIPGGPHLPSRIRDRPIARSARCAATADFDHDGRLDLVVNNFNDRAFLWMNRGPAANWVGLKLVGTQGNRDAVGAVARIRVGSATLVRQVHAAGGYLGQSSLTLHFGLGTATTIDGCEITWRGGRTQSVEGLVPGKVHRIEEPR